MGSPARSAAIRSETKGKTNGVNPYAAGASSDTPPGSARPRVPLTAAQQRALRSELGKRDPATYDPKNLPSTDWSPLASPTSQGAPKGIPMRGPAYTEGTNDDHDGPGGTPSGKTPYVKLKNLNTNSPPYGKGRQRFGTSLKQRAKLGPSLTA